MKLEISVPEAEDIFKEIQKQPEKLLGMIRIDIQEKIGQFLTNMMMVVIFEAHVLLRRVILGSETGYFHIPCLP